MEHDDELIQVCEAHPVDLLPRRQAALVVPVRLRGVPRPRPEAKVKDAGIHKRPQVALDRRRVLPAVVLAQVKPLHADEPALRSRCCLCTLRVGPPGSRPMPLQRRRTCPVLLCSTLLLSFHCPQQPPLAPVPRPARGGAVKGGTPHGHHLSPFPFAPFSDQSLLLSRQASPPLKRAASPSKDSVKTVRKQECVRRHTGGSASTLPLRQGLHLSSAHRALPSADAPLPVLEVPQQASAPALPCTPALHWWCSPSHASSLQPSLRLWASCAHGHSTWRAHTRGRSTL